MSRISGAIQLEAKNISSEQLWVKPEIIKSKLDLIISACLILHLGMSLNWIEGVLKPSDKKTVILIAYFAVVGAILFDSKYKNKFITAADIRWSAILAIPGILSLMINESTVAFHYVAVCVFSITMNVFLRRDLRSSDSTNHILIVLVGLALILVTRYVASYVTFISEFGTGGTFPRLCWEFEVAGLAFGLLVGLVCLINSPNQGLSTPRILCSFPLLTAIGLLANRSAIVATLVFLWISLVMQQIRARSVGVMSCFVVLVFLFQTDSFQQTMLKTVGTGVTDALLLESKAYLRPGRSEKIDNLLSIDKNRVKLWSEVAFVPGVEAFGEGKIGSTSKVETDSLRHNFAVQSLADFGILGCMLFLLFQLFLFYSRVSLDAIRVLITFAIFFFFQNGFSIYMISMQSLIVWTLVCQRLRKFAYDANNDVSS